MSRPSTGENVSRAACPARTLIRIFARMKLVFLHGAPATGKLTVAKALLNVVPGRLLDNHAAIDFARTIFEFGAPGFWELVHQIRLAALEAAAQHGVPLVVITFSTPIRLTFRNLKNLKGSCSGRAASCCLCFFTAPTKKSPVG
jgi:hypothetical protein